MNSYAFIDASNLSYGGVKSLGWKIDYRKLLKYLDDKYGVTKALYFGGVRTHGFQYDQLTDETVPLEPLRKYLQQYVQKRRTKLTVPQLELFDRSIRQVDFYRHLEEFGYDLYLKPMKLFREDDGHMRPKANVDVEMAYTIMRELPRFNRMVMLSGDGDFVFVLRYAKKQKKEVFILARAPRTAKEIRQFAGGNFRDFVRLERAISREE